jgi:hypothetical protein
VARPRLELEATYYDTAEFQLARWGVTLRHRTGEPGPAWTLKLPGGAEEHTLDRQELRVAGDRAAVPREAADLVRAYVRGRGLIPVARLHTSRNPIDIRKPDGTLLAEIVDDAVSVHAGKRVTSRFREVEIETKVSDRKGRDVLRAAVDRITAAGCRGEQPVPKLIRALGAGASRPAELVVPDLGAHPRPDELARHAIAGAELRWLGNEVGRLRDTHVLAGNLQRAIDALPADDVSLGQHVLKRLRRQAQNARESVLAALRSERYDRLLDALVRAAGAGQSLPEGALQRL